VIAEPVLLLAWLVLAHLVADFILQTDGMASDKNAHGRRAVRGLSLHVGAVIVCMLPFVVAFGLPGLVATLAISAAHAVIDRGKIVLTRRAEAAALREGRAAHEEPLPAASLGTAWTPVPAALFALDQLAHVIVIAFAWLTWLVNAPLVEPFASTVTSMLARWDPALVHRAVLVSVVVTALAIVNIRAGSFFVATLVRPRAVLTGGDEATVAAAENEHLDARTTRSSWDVRVGPVRVQAEGRAVGPVSSPVAGSTPAAAPAGTSAGPASPARVGATIGVIERLLIVGLVMTGAQTAVGFVVAAKTIARFRQLEDRHFAEYYLLGTLGSVAVALGSALVATAALSAG
jgi:hypothetical protein